MSTHLTMRERIALESATRESFMADRLRRHAEELDAEHAGLNDMKDMQWQRASDDESSAMRIVGWLFVVLLAIALGAIGAAWWTGQPHLVAAAVECLR